MGSAAASKSEDKTLSSLERYQQFFTEEKTSSLLSPKGSRLLGHAEDLNNEANAATKKRLLLIATMAEILHQKSNTFEDKKLSAQLAKIYKDLNKMVADF